MYIHIYRDTNIPLALCITKRDIYIYIHAYYTPHMKFVKMVDFFPVVLVYMLTPPRSTPAEIYIFNGVRLA